MAFLCDGTNHKTGISNEEYITDILNGGFLNKLVPIENKKIFAIHLGGTGSKSDIGVIETKFSNLEPDELKAKIKTGEIPVIVSISVKKKDKERSGTFDWNNSTTWVTQNIDSPNLTALKAVYAKSRYMRGTLTESARQNQKDSFNRDIKDACDKTLTQMDSDTLRELIHTQMLLPNKEEMVIVRCLDTGKIYYFPFSAHPMYKYISDPKNSFFLTKKRASAKGSQTIMVKNTGDASKTIDTGVRIRVHSNNGASAMLGISTTNKDSMFCVKFQQDNFNDIKSISSVL
jgi:hypothetical protein